MCTVEIHVAPAGSDQHSGDQSSPLATLTGARDAIRRLKAAGELSGPVTVRVQPGTYVQGAPLVLEAQDSGTALAPVEYRAVPGGPCCLTGGVVVNGWTTHADKVCKADVSRLELSRDCRVLVCNGRRQEVARFPNRDPADVNGGSWAYVDGQRIDMYADSPGHDEYHRAHSQRDFWQRNVPELTQTLAMRPQDLRSWSRPEEGEVSVFPRFNWWHYVVPIVAFERASRLLRLAPGCEYEIRPGDRYFVRNLLEELDQQGEWFFDRHTQTLYFWPPAPLENLVVHVATTDALVSLHKCEQITLRRIYFRVLQWDRHHAGRLRGLHDCREHDPQCRRSRWEWRDCEGRSTQCDGRERYPRCGRVRN